MGSSNSRPSAPTEIPEEDDLDGLILDNIHLLDSGEKDAILLCGGERVLAHRSILGAHSEVFEAICKSLKEDKNIVPISDISSNSLRQMIHYLYSGEVLKMPFHDTLKLYGAAKRYEIFPLQRKCKKIISQVMKEDDVCDIANYAYSQDFGEIKDIVISYLVRERKFLASEKWKAFSNTHSALAIDVMLAVFAKMPN